MLTIQWPTTNATAQLRRGVCPPLISTGSGALLLRRCFQSQNGSTVGRDGGGDEGGKGSSRSGSSDAESDIAPQLRGLMEGFAEARELLRDATESMGTTYYEEDLEDAQVQTADVLGQWEALKAGLRAKGRVDELSQLENMHEIHMKQLKAELEAVREAGGH